MSNIPCVYCEQVIPQHEYNAHIRETHAIPTAQDVHNVQQAYGRYYAAYHQARPAQASATPKAPSRASSSSDTTLQGSTTQSSKLSTRFSAWQEQNKFAITQSTQCISADDVSAFRVDRSDQPRTAARALQKATKYDIYEFVAEFRGLASEDLEMCNDLVRKLPVFACFSAYVFTHLKLCAADKPSLLDSFLLKTREWIDQEEEWCLVNYQTIKTHLASFLQESKVQHHKCNQQLLDSARLHYLDVHGLAALLIIYSTDQSHVQSFYAMRDNQAQEILDLLQELIDLKSDQLDEWYKRRFLDAVVRLSRKSRLYPRSLNITGVDNVAGTGDRGGFGAIFRGDLSGRVVALKELHTGRTTDDYLKHFCQEAVVWRNNLLGFSVDDERELVRLFIPQPGCAAFALGTPHMLAKDATSDLGQLLDMANGLEYLHAMQPTIVHGDLKSPNIFVTASGRACLADFGLATVHDAQVSVPTTANGIYGTAGYMAPELISMWDDQENGPARLARLDHRRCDMFAFGCIAYEMYTGGPPFHGNNPTVRNQMLLSGRRPQRPSESRPQTLGLDDDMWMFVESLWAQRPEVRLVAESARDFLKFKVSTTGQSTTGAQDDPEWDTGFLSVLTVSQDPFSL